MTLKDKVLAEIKNNLDLIKEDKFIELYRVVDERVFADEVLGMLSDILIEAGIDPLAVCIPIRHMFAQSKEIKSIDYKYDVVLSCMFMQSSLENISFTNDLTEIEYMAFFGCKNLKSIDLSNTNLKRLGNRSFQACKNMTSVVLPDDVTIIPRYCFDKCSSLEKVVLPKNLQSIWDYAFNDCENLRYLTLPKSVTMIYQFAFHGTGIEKLDYEGTKDEWKLKVKKTPLWRSESNITEVVCSDGSIKYKHL